MTATTLVAVPEIVTGDWLRGIGACSWEVEDFEGKWPEGAALTAANIAAAAENCFDLCWFAGRVLTTDQAAAYDAAVGPARRAYSGILRSRKSDETPDAFLARARAVRATLHQAKAAALASILCPEA